jgi:hypothetical protein
VFAVIGSSANQLRLVGWLLLIHGARRLRARSWTSIDTALLCAGFPQDRFSSAHASGRARGLPEDVGTYWVN